MTWEQRYRLWHTARTSLVLWAGLALVAALLISPLIRWIDAQTGWTVYHFTPDGARALLGALSSSLLTFIVFVLSTTLIVVQLASGQLTPRIIALVLATPGVKIALAFLTFTYSFTLGSLAKVADPVPELHVSIAIILNLLCLMVFFRFVQQLAGLLRPASLMLLVGDSARRVIVQVYPLEYDLRPETATSSALPAIPAETVRFSGQSGVVMGVGIQELLGVARDADAIIELVPQVGDYIARGDTLFRVFGATRPIPRGALRGCVAIGIERTMDQDPRFAFRILVDIANKALSPAINDPTTAVLALDQIHDLLLCLGQRRLDEGTCRDRGGKLRVVYGTPDWPDYVTLAVSEVRQYGKGSLQVIRRLRALLENLIVALPGSRWQPLQQELAILDRAVKRMFPDEEDRACAGIADYQGVGGSDS